MKGKGRWREWGGGDGGVGGGGGAIKASVVLSSLSQIT